MGTISVTTFGADPQTVNSANLNALVTPIITECNGSLDNTNIKAGAGIVDTKLATIATAGKVEGGALTKLDEIPSGAGVIPSANVPSNVMPGSFRNLKVVYTSATQVTVTADRLVLEDDSGNIANISTVSEVIAITTTGAGGLMAGLTEASNTWYYIWIIRKSSDGTTDGILTADPAEIASMPTDYDQYTLVGAVRNDNSSNFVSFTQYGRKYCYSTWQTIATGATGATNAWVSIDTTAFIPSALSLIGFGTIASGGETTTIAITNTTATPTLATVAPNKVGNPDVSNGNIGLYWIFDILTANTLYWYSSSTTSSRTYLHGFEITNLT